MKLPSGWTRRTLGDVAEIASGGNAPQGEQYFQDGKHPFVRVQHFDGTTTNVTRWDLITDEAVRDYRLKLVPAGTILLPKSGASIRLEKRAVLPVDAYVVSHFCTVQAKPLECQKFLFCLLKTIRFSQDSNGSTLPFLNLSKIADYEFSCPPLPEQRKIAAVLAKMQRAVELQEAILANVRELKKSLMHRLFTHGLRGEKLKRTSLGRVPKSWRTSRLDDFVVLQRGFDITKRQQADGRIPVISSSGINSYHDVAMVKGPGVVVGRKGSLGTVHFIEQDYWPHDTTLWVKDFKGNYPMFISYFFQTLRFERFDSGTSNPTLNRNLVHALEVSLPDVPEQREIAHILQTLDEKLAVHESKKSALQDLFKTTLNQLMTGVVRVPDLDIDTSEVEG